MDNTELGTVINLQNCIENQKELDFHPRFWEKSEAELYTQLAQHVKSYQCYIDEYEGKNDLGIHERNLNEYSKKFMQIAFAK